jgi:hypothetical protein
MIKENFISAELRFLFSTCFEGRKTGERENEMDANYYEKTDIYRKSNMKAMNRCNHRCQADYIQCNGAAGNYTPSVSLYYSGRGNAFNIRCKKD